MRAWTGQASQSFCHPVIKPLRHKNTDTHASLEPFLQALHFPIPPHDFGDTGAGRHFWSLLYVMYTTLQCATWSIKDMAFKIMKNRASYTLEIVKIFFLLIFLSFWLSFYLSFFFIYVFIHFFKIILFFIFYHFFIILFFMFFHVFSCFFIFFHFFIIFHHFCFQWCKNCPKNKKLQFSSSFFHFFYHFFNHFCFQWWNWWKMMKNEKKMKKWKKKWKKTRKIAIFQKMKNWNFPRVFFMQFSKKWKIEIFLGFFSFFFIIFASSGAKIFRKIKNCNFHRVFFIFYSFVYHFCFQWWNWWKMMKNDGKW